VAGDINFLWLQVTACIPLIPAQSQCESVESEDV